MNCVLPFRSFCFESDKSYSSYKGVITDQKDKTQGKNIVKVVEQLDSGME